MRVVVTGATGNVGTSVVEAAGRSEEIDEVIGIARRVPAWQPPKTRWMQADILDADLAEHFRGADVVINLAWAIQPSRDPRTLERVNIEGSRRVFGAAVAAGVPKLVHASSVGAYSPGPKDRRVSESWRTGGIESSFYSRHKAIVEQILDVFEERNPEVSVVRMRPGLIFKGEAASEIRRLFAGALVPGFLMRKGLVPLIPRIPGLLFQAVHSLDVGEAYVRAATRDVAGAFNVAADPPIGTDEIASIFHARTFPLPERLARGLTDATWRLHLQPTPPGWLDIALGVPLISSQRAKAELDWEPTHSALEALDELLEGIREGEGKETPALEPSGLPGRIDELRTGHGRKQMARDPSDQLVSSLTDAHSIEEQALVQMEAAPDLAADEQLKQAFSEHLEETRVHERRVRDLLEAQGESPSKLKDAAGAGGGLAMLLFAGVQPDSPGKLTAHAFSYEHMEYAAYELLRRVADQAGDAESARVAAEIALEEEEMASRLADSFGRAVDASIATNPRADADDALGGLLGTYLRDAHAIEAQAIRLLEAAPSIVNDPELANLFSEHLAETEEHERKVRERIESRGESVSSLKDAALSVGGIGIGAFFGSQPDTTAKLSGFVYAFENLEIASYELLAQMADRAGDEASGQLARELLADEYAARNKLKSSWDRTATMVHQ